MPENWGEPVRILLCRDPTRRVAIIQRTDGLFAIRPERLKRARFFSDKTATSKWLPLERASGLFASAELAEKEAYALYPWVRPDRASEILEYPDPIRKEILALATKYLRGELPVIETARELHRFWNVCDPDLEPHIRVFVGINSETDALPIGDVRPLWSPEALAREDVKIAAAELFYLESATKAATRLSQLLSVKKPD